MSLEIIAAVTAGFISFIAKPLIEWISTRFHKGETNVKRLKIGFKQKENLTHEELQTEIRKLENLIKELKAQKIIVDNVDLENLKIEIETEDTTATNTAFNKLGRRE